MDKIAVENDLDVFIESAGIFAEDGQGASENAIKASKYLSLWQKARYTHYLNMQVQAVTYPILTAVTLKNMKKLRKRFMTHL